EQILGIPTVSDRIAQMVVKLEFEPQVEPHFLADSYGYRPNKSALDAESDEDDLRVEAKYTCQAIVKYQPTFGATG
ncbi:[similarity to] reverse transcriptase/maturase protein, partial [methanotrophic bacterial endosymbiont of Bathymodiolus sp.]